ncbi:MAG: coenzyme F420-0:L-glutamate ligase [Alphaproteobacteria bacterium]|nr:coenzyme F420-0:L-glutamate ligase [Alphaproteobacteria bacterium]
MRAHAIKTHKIQASESLETVIKSAIPSIQEGSILAITSKVVSLAENQLIQKDQVPSKMDLIRSESDYYLDAPSSYDICLTIRDHILIPTAGIDESNAVDAYILYPRNVQASAARLWHFVRTHYGVQSVGIIITDSHTTPLRRGVVGLGLGWCGFKALHNYVGKPDIYGSPLRVTMANLLDGYAATAVCLMGEGAEQTPLALIEDVPNVVFTTTPPTDSEIADLMMPKEQDLYGPLLNAVNWTKGKRQP